MPKLRLLSSDETIKALAKLGFTLKKKKRGSHASYVRRTDERSFVVTVVLDRKEISRGTLDSIIRGSGVDAELFIDLATTSRKAP